MNVSMLAILLIGAARFIGSSFAPAAYSPDGGDRCNQAYNCERRAHCFSLLRGKSLGEEKRYSRAKHGTSDDCKCELWKAEMRFFHKQHVDALATGVNCAGNVANELSEPSRFAAVPSRPTAQWREVIRLL
jgi:hypothetical protein